MADVKRTMSVLRIHGLSLGAAMGMSDQQLQELAGCGPATIALIRSMGDLIRSDENGLLLVQDLDELCRRAVERIVHDLGDRGGWWESIDDQIQAEVIAAWESILQEAFRF